MEGEEGKIIHKELGYKLVGILYSVYNDLGYGYQEKHYEKALAVYLADQGIDFIRQAPHKLEVKGVVIGRYYLDFLIDNKIILELKKGRYFSKQNIDQVKGYLKATNLKLAILANFTPDGVKIFRVLNPNNVNHDS